MQIRKFLRAYLVFTSKDRLGVIAVLAMSLLIIVLPHLTAPPKNSFPAKETVLLVEQMDTALAADSSPANAGFIRESHASTSGTPPAFVNGELFRFDPNTLPAEGWQRLGLNSKTSNTIVNYRNKGGMFYRAEDIRKIWDMPEGFFERVKDSIVIKSTGENEYPDHFQQKVFSRLEKKPVHININEAGLNDFIALPGIGNTLANRITKFRASLGGFYSIEQVRETYGLPDSTFQKIRESLELSGPVKKLNVNTATKDELKTHPYISWNLANAIVEYRNQHGAFSSLDDLKNIVLMEEETYKKLVNYLTL